MRVFVQNQMMNAVHSSWSSMMLDVLLVASLPVQVWAYKILMIPMLGQSHVFSIAAIAEGLINRGHDVTFFIGENYHLHVPELSTRITFSVVRYNDTTNGVYVDYDAMDESTIKSVIEEGKKRKEPTPIYRKMYVGPIFP